MQLIPFLADLSRDPELSALFRREPRTLMKRKGLGRREQSLLLAGDRQGLAAAVAREVTTHSGRVATRTPWPGGGKPAFDSVQPVSGKQGQTVSVAIRLYVNMGRSGLRAGARTRQPPEKVEGFLVRGKTKIEGRVSNVREPNDACHYARYDAVFALPKDARPGKYRVLTVVHVSPQPDRYLSRGAPFEVQKASR